MQIQDRLGQDAAIMQADLLQLPSIMHCPRYHALPHYYALILPSLLGTDTVRAFMHCLHYNAQILLGIVN